MVHYLAQRLLGALSVMFVVSIVAFALYALTPGDPAVVLLEASGTHSPPARPSRPNVPSSTSMIRCSCDT